MHPRKFEKLRSQLAAETTYIAIAQQYCRCPDCQHTSQIKALLISRESVLDTSNHYQLPQLNIFALIHPP